ncbi:MAG: hypothetical protein WBL00_09090, partial [Bacteroidales bacterium]
SDENMYVVLTVTAIRRSPGTSAATLARNVLSVPPDRAITAEPDPERIDLSLSSFRAAVIIRP